MMDILKYAILVLGFTGIALGLYGLLGPSLQAYLAARHGGHGRREDDYDEFEDDADFDTPYEQLRDLIQQRQTGAIGTQPGSPFPMPQAVAIENDEDYFEDEYEDEPDAGEDRDEPVRVARPAADTASMPVGSIPEPVEMEEPAEDEAQLEPIVVAGATTPGSDPDDILSLFAESEQESNTPAVLREVVGTVTIEQVVAEARGLRELLAGTRGR